MAAIPGINSNPTEPQQVQEEDTTMNISHLLIKGYVEDVIKEARFEVKFRSLTTEEVQKVDTLVVAMNGTEDHRAARNARYLKYLAISVQYVFIKEGADKTTQWDFSELDSAGKEEALKRTSTFIFNKLFALYIQFEDKVGLLIKETDPKNS
jgi:hypothetical protein